MSRIVALLLLITMMFSFISLTACGGNAEAADGEADAEAAGGEGTAAEGDGETVFESDNVNYVYYPELNPVTRMARDDYGILIGSTRFDDPVLLMGRGDDELVIILVRVRPNIDAACVQAAWGNVTIGRGQMVVCTAVLDGWCRVKVYPGRFDGYIRSDLLEAYDSRRRYFADNIYFFDETFGPENPWPSETLVDVRSVVPDIEYYMIYATPDNFTGKPQYSRDIPILHRETALKLREAQALFRKDGYSIKLYDAYRPVSASDRLNRNIIYRTYEGQGGTAAHAKAASVDITLIDAEGNELEMPTPMYTFNSTAIRDTDNMNYTQAARENMDYMKKIMEKAGFEAPTYTEWWHFEDREFDEFSPMDVEFAHIVVSEY